MILTQKAHSNPSIWKIMSIIEKKAVGNPFQSSLINHSYHGYKNAPYIFPDDEKELERLQIIHDCMYRFLGGNIIIPISSNSDLIGNLTFNIKMLIIVDIGTGSGLWAIDMADDYPNTRIIGTDISPIQPNDIPPNCEFRLENLLEGLYLHNGTVDLLHSRLIYHIKFSLMIRWLAVGIPTNRWQSYLREIHRVLKPGIGRLQMIEFDRGGVGHLYSENNSLPEDSSLSKVFPN